MGFCGVHAAIRAESHLIAPACVLNVLDCVKVIAVNVPSEFLLIPRLMVSLLPRSMWVVVFILLGRLRLP